MISAERAKSGRDRRDHQGFPSRPRPPSRGGRVQVTKSGCSTSSALGATVHAERSGLDRVVLRPPQARVPAPGEDQRRRRAGTRARPAAGALQHRASARRHSVTSPPTTNTAAAVRPSEPPAEKDWRPPTNSGLPPTASYEKITNDRRPVAGYYNPELMHLVRRTSALVRSGSPLPSVACTKRRTIRRPFGRAGYPSASA